MPIAHVANALASTSWFSCWLFSVTKMKNSLVFEVIGASTAITRAFSFFLAYLRRLIFGEICEHSNERDYTQTLHAACSAH
jgi:hypothetical protein